VLGLMLLAGLLGARRPGLPIAALASLGTLGVLFLGVRVGQAGGDLVYRHGAAQAYTSTAAAGETSGTVASPEVDERD
ncbi:MAG TPA: hypothetical protein VFP58_12855, partial [Candidatus Eisenbacteria bacterium]|nr:hypothetical protein [Candidatus Eisenbacteria bacterium]